MAKSRRAPDEPVRSRRPADDDDDDDTPRKGKRADDDDDDDEGSDGPQMPRRKRKSASGPAKIVLRSIAGVIGAIGLIVLLYWVYSPIGTDHQLLCYFPPETVRLQGYDYNEALRNAKLKEVHDTLIANYKVFGEPRFNKNSGVDFNDVDKYMSGTAMGNYEEEKDLPPDSQLRRGSLTVIRFTKDVDPATFADSIGGKFKAVEQKGRDGRTYYQVQEYRTVTIQGKSHEELHDDICFFFPTKRIIVYATTQRELEEAMKRTPGRIAIDGDMRELADKVDGLYFQANKGWSINNTGGNSQALTMSFIDSEVSDPSKWNGVVGTASWFASNGNDFLYASANLYSDVPTAKAVRVKLDASFKKAKEDIYRSESGKPSGLEDPFNPKKEKGAAGGFGGGMNSTSSEQTKDIIEALSEYSKYARVRRQGRFVIVEGTISHGMPEQGTFEKFWAAVGPKYRLQRPGGGMMGGGGGLGPMPGGGGPGPIMPGALPLQDASMADLIQATAYHEAGHAVAALTLGRPVAWVSIRPSRQYLGICKFDKGVFRRSEDWIEREAIISLAGPAAEAGFTGELDWGGAARDHDYAFDLARRRTGDEKKADRLVKRWLSKADHLLGREEAWAAVERIARELLRIEEISGRAVKHFFEGR